MTYFLTYGTYLCIPPPFVITYNDEGTGGLGVDATFGGCFKMSPIPCFNGCGYGPLAFVSPFELQDVEGSENDKKWVGSGQICAGGCCPCLTNTGDWGISSAEEDGSTPEKQSKIVPMSNAWPPCLHGKVAWAPHPEGGRPAHQDADRGRDDARQGPDDHGPARFAGAG